MIKFFRHIITVIASEAWQSYKLSIKTNRLPRLFVPRNDKTIISMIKFFRHIRRNLMEDRTL